MNQNAVYIFSPFILPNKDISLLSNFNDSETSYFKATLFLNLIENASKKKEKTDLFVILADQEKTSEFDGLEDLQFIYATDKSLDVLFSDKLTKEFNNHKYNILIAADVIDLRASDLEKYFNLLGIDEKTILLSKSSSDVISVFGFCGFSEELIKFFVESELSLQKFLGFNKSCSYYINMTKDVFAVKDLNDFKKLYSNLSLKSSLEYCSQEMHERFTHLFVEYKDLLK